MSSTSGTRDEQPLDPALVRVQRRLRRLMIISLSTLGLGVVAVLAAIIYRFFIMDSSERQTLLDAAATAPPTVAGEITAETLGLAPDAELIEQTLDGDRMAFTYRDGADHVTFIVDLDTMEVVYQVRMAAE